MKSRLKNYLISFGMSFVLATSFGGTGLQLSYAGEENIKEEEIQQADLDISEGEGALTDSDSENGEVYGENEAEPDEALEETDDVQEDGAGNSNEEMDAGYAADDYDPEPMTEGEEEQSKEEESPELSENGEEESEQPEEEEEDPEALEEGSDYLEEGEEDPEALEEKLEQPEEEGEAPEAMEEESEQPEEEDPEAMEEESEQPEEEDPEAMEEESEQPEEEDPEAMEEESDQSEEEDPEAMEEELEQPEEEDPEASEEKNDLPEDGQKDSDEPDEQDAVVKELNPDDEKVWKDTPISLTKYGESVYDAATGVLIDGMGAVPKGISTPESFDRQDLLQTQNNNPEDTVEIISVINTVEPVVTELAQASKMLTANTIVQTNAGNLYLSKLLQSDPKLYYNDLASVAATISQKAYDEKKVKNYLVEDLGFSEDNIKTYNYDQSYAYTLATAPYVGEDAKENSEILVLGIRGSATIKEFIYDSLSRGKYPHLNQKVYGVVDTFYNELKENLYQLLYDKDRDYRILVTGHSLGGATANLAAAHMIDEGNKNVFCYTFGAIDSITANEPVTDGFESIHNVYSNYDTFSPSQYGGIMLNGAGRKYGKFGYIHDYSIDHRTEKQKESWPTTQIYAAVNHAVDRYVEDVNNHMVENAVLAKINENKPWHTMGLLYRLTSSNQGDYNSASEENENGILYYDGYEQEASLQPIQETNLMEEKPQEADVTINQNQSYSSPAGQSQSQIMFESARQSQSQGAVEIVGQSKNQGTSETAGQTQDQSSPAKTGQPQTIGKKARDRLVLAASNVPQIVNKLIPSSISNLFRDSIDEETSLDELVVLLFPKDLEAVHFDVVDKEESYTDFIRELTNIANLKSVASLQTDYLDCEDASILSEDIVRTPDERTFVMIDIMNIGDRELKVGIDHICVNGIDTGREEVVSELIGRDQHAILNIAVDQLMDQEALETTGITSMDELSFVLHLDEADGECLKTTEEIVLSLS